MSDYQTLKDQLSKLNKIGIALSSEHHLDELLEMIVKESRILTRSDAGSLYLKQNNNLIFCVAQNDTLDKQHNDKKIFKKITIPISTESLAGYVALRGEVLNIEDVHNIPQTAEYRFMESVDRESHYYTKSMLVVPMPNIKGQIIGVLSLINSLDENGQPQPYDKEFEDMTLSLASQAAVAIKNTQLLEQTKQLQLDTIKRLALASEYRDDTTGKHIERISEYSTLIAKNLGLTEKEIEIIKYASPMHDIGKIGIPDAVLLKPGKLTPEEFDIIKTHADIGAKILGGSDKELLIACEIIAMTHHEKFDGTGYPKGLKGNDIPLYGRIVSIADVFDALTSERPYKTAFSVEKSFTIIKDDTGTHFDPEIAKAFMHDRDKVCEIVERYKKNHRPL